MKKTKLGVFAGFGCALVLISVFVLISCLTPALAAKNETSQPEEKAAPVQKVAVYEYKKSGEGFSQIESIRILQNAKNGPASMMTDRTTPTSQIITNMERGTFQIDGTQINIVTNKSIYAGIKKEKLLVIDGKEYLLVE